ncbi:hypothetical protein E3H11_11965 [Bradyrhizobium brasilense]|nr:hypothetical protein [Bradyrhizobium brasilense]
MSRTPARATQADIHRALKAAKQAGASAVLVLPDGTIRIELGSKPSEVVDDRAPAPRRRIVL